MFSVLSSLHAGSFVLSLVVAVAGLITPASASVGGPHSGPLVARFNGRVTALTGPPDSPSGLTLQLRDRTVDVRIGSGVDCAYALNCTARSAEAEVEGLQVGDYALVSARRINRTWVAFHIDFDVQPIDMRPPPIVTGTIVKVTPNGLRFQLRVVTGGVGLHWVTIGPKTIFRVDGQLTDMPPTLSKGDAVRVTIRVTDRGWAAIEVDLRTTGGSP